MSRRREPRPSPRSRTTTVARADRRGGPRPWPILLAIPLLVATLGVGWAIWSTSPYRIEREAREAAAAEDWEHAVALYHRLNSSLLTSSATLLAEARVNLARGRARDAESALRRATTLDPSATEPWLLWLELLRVEDRQAEALRVGQLAERAVDPVNRTRLRRAWTLALLADAPDSVALPTLRRWAESDPDDLDARLALLARQALSGPRGAGPVSTRAAARVATLEDLLGQHPGNPGVRAATVAALAETGQIDRGRELLDTWPDSQRDPRYHRLRGRWDLEYDHEPARAADAFRQVLEHLPYDWKTRARLARALHALGNDERAAAEALTVARHREILEPFRLGPRLTSSLERLDDPEALDDLASLCQSLGLTVLADAWRDEAATVRRVRASASPGLSGPSGKSGPPSASTR